MRAFFWKVRIFWALFFEKRFTKSLVTAMMEVWRREGNLDSAVDVLRWRVFLTAHRTGERLECDEVSLPVNVNDAHAMDVEAVDLPDMGGDRGDPQRTTEQLLEDGTRVLYLSREYASWRDQRPINGHAEGWFACRWRYGAPPFLLFGESPDEVYEKLWRLCPRTAKLFAVCSLNVPPPVEHPTSEELHVEAVDLPEQGADDGDPEKTVEQLSEHDGRKAHWDSYCYTSWRRHQPVHGHTTGIIACRWRYGAPPYLLFREGEDVCALISDLWKRCPRTAELFEVQRLEVRSADEKIAG